MSKIFLLVEVTDSEMEGFDTKVQIFKTEEEASGCLKNHYLDITDAKEIEWAELNSDSYSVQMWEDGCYKRFEGTIIEKTIE